MVRHKPLMVHHPSRRVTFVNVYDAPREPQDSAIETRLAKFGTILSVCCGKCQEFPDVFNGVRHVCMLLDLGKEPTTPGPKNLLAKISVSVSYAIRVVVF